eukprot:801035-Rhodomonas_salina.1
MMYGCSIRARYETAGTDTQYGARCMTQSMQCDARERRHVSKGSTRHVSKGSTRHVSKGSTRLSTH